MIHKRSTLLLATIITVIPIISFAIFIHKTRCIPEIKIVLEIDKSKINANYEISDLSIKKLQIAINESNYANNTEKLIQIFEREREHYIVLITIITLIITVFSIFIILNRFVEKDEYEKIKKDLSSQKEEFEVELNEIKISNLCLNIEAITEKLNKKTTLFLENNIRVMNYDQYELFIEQSIARIIEKLNTYTVSDDKVERLIFDFRNLLVSAMVYSQNNKWTSNIEFDVDKNIVFKNLLRTFKIHMKIEFYNSFKEKIEKLSAVKINWGEY